MCGGTAREVLKCGTPLRYRINRGKARVNRGTFQVPSALAPTCVARMRNKGGASIDRDKDGIANYCKAGIMARCHSGMPKLKRQRPK